MSASMDLLQTAALREQIIVKAWSEPAFKTELMANPKAALKAHFNIELPENLQLVVAEEMADQVLFVLPPNPIMNADEAIVPAENW